MMEFSKISDRIEVLENQEGKDVDAEVKDDSAIRPINIEFTGSRSKYGKNISYLVYD